MACVVEKKTVALHGDGACRGGGGDEDDGTCNTPATASQDWEEALFGDAEEGALL
jgi:hypothetical protein